MTRQRNLEIEMVVTKLGGEMAIAERKVEQEREHELSAARAEQAEERRAAEDAHTMLKEKYTRLVEAHADLGASASEQAEQLAEAHSLADATVVEAEGKHSELIAQRDALDAVRSM